MSNAVLLVERSGTVTTLTLNRPASKNALDAELVDALRAAVQEVARDASVRVVVLGGAGGSFCAGADLKASLSSGSGAGPVDTVLDALHDVIRTITSAPKPFIAAVDGAAVGIGCDLALSCDLRVLSSRGYLQEIFVKIGLMPDGGGTFWLPRLVGLGRAMEYMMLGQRIDASLAREVGLANRVADEGAFRDEVRALADQLAHAPPLALARIKRAVVANAATTLDQALAHEKNSQLELLASEDLMEGVAAWIGKRDAVFRGC